MLNLSFNKEPHYIDTQLHLNVSDYQITQNTSLLKNNITALLGIQYSI
jgi:hypothetical protein